MDGSTKQPPRGGWHRLLWLPAVLLLPVPAFISAVMVQLELRPPCALPAPDGNDVSCADPLTGAEVATWAAWWGAGGLTLLAALVCLFFARRSLAAAWASPLLTAAAVPVATGAALLTWTVAG